MRRIRRPTGKIGGAKIRGVKLGAGDLGRAVNAARARRGRIPVVVSRQCLARVESETFGKRRTRKTERDTARGCQFDKLAPRNTHELLPLFRRWLCPRSLTGRTLTFAHATNAFDSVKIGNRRRSGSRRDQSRPLLGAERHGWRQERRHFTLGIFRDDRGAGVAAHQFVVHQMIIAEEHRADGAVGDDAGQRVRACRRASW